MKRAIFLIKLNSTTLRFYQVHMTDAEVKAGLTLTPSEKTVNVVSKPVLDVHSEHRSLAPSNAWVS